MGLVITSTAADIFVYWPDRKLADLTDGNVVGKAAAFAHEQ
jgi:hypothetical protein